jgi:YHS domain-containing protein
MKLIQIMVLLFCIVFTLGCQKASTPPVAENNVATPSTLATDTQTAPQPDWGKKAVCRVCKMDVTVDRTTPIYRYKDTTYYFCSQGDKNLFVKNPEKYISPDK